MAFWSTERFRQRAAQEILVVPFDPQNVKHGAYELAVGPEVSITSKDSKTKEALDAGEAFVIPPGQFGLLLTEEIVSAPLDAIGFISIRASIKFEGLVNVSGFHVDPGFSGRLKFSVYNAGSRNIVLSRGDRVFMLWFGDLDRTTSDGYGGQQAGQNEITSRDLMRMQGEVASPAQLQKDIVDLSHSVTNLKYVVSVFVTIAGSLSIALIVTLLRGGVLSPPPTPAVFQQPSQLGAPTAPAAEAPKAERRIERRTLPSSPSTNEGSSETRKPATRENPR